MLTSVGRTATVAWCPLNSSHPLLATGTVAGALDASFSSATELEIFQLSVLSHQISPEPVAVVSTSARFNRLAWTLPFNADRPQGILAGGMENGELYLYDPAVLIEQRLNNSYPLEGEPNPAVIFSDRAHSSEVLGLEFNPFQPNLLASAAGQSDIRIWDLNQLSKPYVPGARSQKMDGITHLSWNRQVQHILATSSASGFASVWDLKNRREVVHLGYGLGGMGHGLGISGMGSGRRGISAVVWNPDIPTQILTASEDDENPVILCWDLRNAHAPEKILKGHTKGILSMSWCQQDSSILLSCGKDSRTICWNPRSGDVVGELSSRSNWTFDVQFSPRNPNLFSAAAYDGFVNVHKLGSGGSIVTKKDEEISNLFKKNDDPFALDGGILQKPAELTLPHPPKWFKRPAGASFSFGNKLVCFSSNQKMARKVIVKRIVSDVEFVKRSHELEHVTDFKEYSQMKKDQLANDANESTTWSVLHVLFEQDARGRLVKALGLEKDKVSLELLEASKEVVKEEESITTTTTTVTEAEVITETTTEISTESLNDASSFFAGSETLTLQTSEDTTHQRLSASGLYKINHIIRRAVIIGDFDTAVQACLRAERLADALIVAICGGKELLERTREAIFERRNHDNGADTYLRLLRHIAGSNLQAIVNQTELSQWDEILVVLCTYAKGEEFGGLCARLGERLEAQNEKNAILCYLVAGHLEKVVTAWVRRLTDRTSLVLQYFMERVTTFRKAIDFVDEKLVTVNTPNDADVEEFPLRQLYDEYGRYAELLISQGELDSAAKYLALIPNAYVDEGSLIPILKDRLHRAGVKGLLDADSILFPFQRVYVGRPAPAPAPASAFMGSTNAGAALTGGYNHSNYYANPTHTIPTPAAAASATPMKPEHGYHQPGYGAYPSAPGFGGVAQPYHYGGATTAPAAAAATTAAYANYANPANYPAAGGGYAGNYGGNYGIQKSPALNSSEPPPPPPVNRSGAVPGWNDIPEDFVKAPMKKAPLPPAKPIMNPFANPPPPAAAANYGYGAPQPHPPPPPPPKDVAPPPAYPNAGYAPTGNPPYGAMGGNQYGAQPHAGNPYGGPAPPAPPPPPPQQMQPQAGYPRVVTQNQPAAPPAPPVKLRPATGDRSQIPPARLPILLSFDRELATLKQRAPINPNQKRMLDDMEKRILVLSDALNNDEIAPHLVDQLLVISQRLDAEDYTNAFAQTMDMFSKSGGANWTVGVKRLVETTYNSHPR